MESQSRGSLRLVEIPKKRKQNHGPGHPRRPARICYLYNVLHESSEIEERWNRNRLPLLSIYKQGAHNRVVRMHVRKETPTLCTPVKDIIQMAEDRVRRSWVPIPHGPPVNRGLGLQVVRSEEHTSELQPLAY